MKVAVVGGGIAGTAAAWALRRGGADVTLFHDRAGASALYAGALDVTGWEEDPEDESVEPELVAFATAFEAWTVGTRGARVATYDGVLRPARGVDSALLDLRALAGRVVFVPDAPVDGWDAGSLVRALGASRLAVQSRISFRVARVAGMVDAAEGSGSPFDVAALHDDATRVERLAECLAQGEPSADAWLLGPWLGTRPGVADRLRQLLGKPCGETTSPPGGAAGARFEASRDSLLVGCGVHVRRTSVGSVERHAHRFRVAPRSRTATVDDSGFDVVVLAIGGLASGLSMEENGFGASLEGPFSVGIGHRAVGRPSTTHGVDVAALGLHALESVGIVSEGSAVSGEAGLFVAGDCVMRRPRTALEAASAGIAAASLARQG
ncbi:MAG TPA: NAD(P)-binding protein [Polyangiaceae bacterium]|nr:NAD(P)-binding protein [Polyangiaceae bacterium]